MPENCQKPHMDRQPRHLVVLIVLTIVAPALVSLINSNLERLVIMCLGLGACASAWLVAWFVARKLRWGSLPFATPEPTEVMVSESMRGHSIACFFLAAFFFLPAVLSLFATRFRLSLVNWLLGRAWWENNAAVLGELGPVTWAIAYAFLGIHYFTARYQWLAHLAVFHAILGWLLLTLAIWMRISP